MTNALLEIKSMYEEHGLTVDEIAQATGYDALAVKNSLMQSSIKYRKDNTDLMVQDTGEGGIITSEDDKLLIEAGKMLVQCAEDERVRADLIKYLHNEFKGRNDSEKKSGLKVNVLILNQVISKARQLTHIQEEDLIDVKSAKIA